VALLADDFECTSSNRITEIHLWTSWRFDDVPDDFKPLAFRLSIWSDNPSNESVAYSTPSNLLWEKAFSYDEYQESEYAELQDYEWWWDPNDTHTPPEPHGDRKIWQFNFFIDPVEAHLQTGTVENPVTYWLGVEVFYPDPSFRLGWKTSTDHWNDDAVYRDILEPLNPWKELRYPEEHPWRYESIDLAFVIGTMPKKDPKWIQRLDTEHGLDVIASGSPTLPYEPVHDDFVSDGRPITHIRWWGSYAGYLIDIDPEFGVPPPPQRPHEFDIYWHADIPAGVETNYSLPGEQLFKGYFSVKPEGYSHARASVVEQYATSIVHVTMGGYTNWEHKFVYDLELHRRDEWREKEGVIYWLGIAAWYTNDIVLNPWGWATAWPDDGFNDDAVRENFYNEVGYDELRYEDLFPGHPYGSNSVDMAFVLFTDIIGRRAVKWRQLPDMEWGTDLNSYTWNLEDPGAGFLRADDFISDGRRITDIHWWGSYPGYEAVFSNQPPDPHPGMQPVGFKLSWHTNMMEGFPMPGMLLTNIFVPIGACHETYYGPVEQDWPEGITNYEHEYQYYVDLNDPDISEGPWYESTGGHYWVDIQAVFPHDGFPYEWGWKITTNVQEGISVLSEYGGPWMEAELQAPHPHEGRPVDLAFEITTDEVGTNKYYKPIIITNIQAIATNQRKIWSVGDWGGGTQFLQRCYDLLVTNWVNVLNKPAPHPPPFTNVWSPPANSDTNRHYRILQK